MCMVVHLGGLRGVAIVVPGLCVAGASVVGDIECSLATPPARAALVPVECYLHEWGVRRRREGVLIMCGLSRAGGVPWIAVEASRGCWRGELLW